MKNLVSIALISCCMVVLQLGTAFGNNPQPSLITIEEVQTRAQRFGNVLELPLVITHPQQIRNLIWNTLATATIKLDEIIAMPIDSDPALALEDALYPVHCVLNYAEFLARVHPETEIRNAATDMSQTLRGWLLGVWQREDLYHTITAFPVPKDPEDQRLVELMLNEFARYGMDRPYADRHKALGLLEKLAQLEADFSLELPEPRVIELLPEELEGVPEKYLEGLAINKAGAYLVNCNSSLYFTLVRSVKIEATRKKLFLAQVTVAPGNLQRVGQMQKFRQQIAQLLGQSSWAAHQARGRLVGSPEETLNLLLELNEKLHPAFLAKLEELRQFKTQETGDPDTPLHIHDIGYYLTQYKKWYLVNVEEVKKHLPAEKLLSGTLALLENLYGLKFEQVQSPWSWADLYLVSRAGTDEPLALVFLDLYERKGKYPNACTLPLLTARRFHGQTHRPTLAVSCLFGASSLLTQDQVRSLLHEFGGHAMHEVCTRVEHARFTGGLLPIDLVELVARVSEKSIWEQDNLVSVEQLAGPDQAAALISTQWALTLSVLDLLLHGVESEKYTPKNKEPVGLSNEIIEHFFWPYPEGTHWLTSFTHYSIPEYAGQYYVYLLDAILAAYISSDFRPAKWQKEVLETGNSRDPRVSIEQYLGYPLILDESLINPFLRGLGVHVQD